ncbi:MAG: hypothetical protein WAN51_13145, partial [Alphaproteobacteria bacterium]
ALLQQDLHVEYKAFGRRLLLALKNIGIRMAWWRICRYGDRCFNAATRFGVLVNGTGRVTADSQHWQFGIDKKRNYRSEPKNAKDIAHRFHVS